MKTIARWSSHHIIASRLLIAICHIGIACLASYVGISLLHSGLHIPVPIFWISIIIFLSILLTYKTPTYKNLSFYRKKLVDISVAACSFIVITASANQPTTSHFIFYSQLSGALPEKVEPQKKMSIKELKRQWKEIKMLAKKEGASAGRIGIAVLVGLLLIMLVASASCSASCNGQGALAAIILIGGLAGVFLIVRAIIRGGRRRNNNPSVQPSP